MYALLYLACCWLTIILAFNEPMSVSIPFSIVTGAALIGAAIIFKGKK